MTDWREIRMDEIDWRALTSQMGRTVHPLRRLSRHEPNRSPEPYATGCWSNLTLGEVADAVNGPEGCTCDVPMSRIEAAERGRRIAEEHVERLREARDRRLDEQRTLWWQNKCLRKRIAELESRDG